jgi:hypothetical protein
MSYTGRFKAVIQSLRRLLGRSLAAENINQVFKNKPPFQRQVYVVVAFIIVIVDFYNVETIRFNIIYQMSSLFAMKGRHYALRSIFQSYYKVLLF